MTAYGLTASPAAVSGQLVGGTLFALDLGGLDWALVLPRQRAERRERDRPGRPRGWPAWCIGLLVLAGLLDAAFAARQHALSRRGSAR